MPETLYRLLAPFEYGWGCGCGLGVAVGRGGCSCSLSSRLRAGSDCAPMDGGVKEPVVGVVVLLASLDSSADRSVLKLALDRRRSSLKFKKDGAMTQVAGARARCGLRSYTRR